MRLSIGSNWVLDSTAASSTVTSAALRLDFDLPLVPRATGNEYRIPGLRIFVEAASESALKTAVEAIELQFRQCDGKTISFANTTGTPLCAIDTSIYPRSRIEYSVDYGDMFAEITFDIVGYQPDAPVAGGAGDAMGQRGEIVWELEIGPNGLTGATATAEFGPTTGSTAQENAAAWINSFYTNPPTNLPAFLPARLRPVHALPVATQKPNQTTLALASYDPVAVTILFREVYSGIANIPSLVTDLVSTVSVANEDAMDLRAGETLGPALVVLQGSFTVRTEAPSEWSGSLTQVARGAILAKAQEVYDLIEADFKTVYARFSLYDLGEPTIDVGLDSGRVTFSRAFSTTRIRKWRERTRVRNVDPKVFNRDYLGRDVIHQDKGGPVATLSHSLYIEALEAAQPYRAPALTDGWERTDAELDVLMTAKLAGGRLVFVTDGASNWRYANPTERGETGETGANGRIIEQSAASIGNGTI